jgi:enoyl-CoA hydratase
MGATYFLPQVVGPALATELLLTARVIDADEGLRMGLISRVVESSELLNGAAAIAQEISATGP